MSFYSICGCRRQNRCCNQSFNCCCRCENYFNNCGCGTNTFFESIRPIRPINPVTPTIPFVLRLVNYINTTAQTVAAGANVVLTGSTYQNLNTTLDTATGVVTVPDAGVYRIDYHLVATAVDPGDFAFGITVGGVTQPSSVATGTSTAATELYPVSGTVTLNLPAGTTIALVNTGTSAATVNPASLTITRLNN